MKTNKQRWRERGDVDYIRIEARPPLKDPDKTRCRFTLEWVSAADLGACEAFQAIIQTVLRIGSGARVREFYVALRELAENWQ